MLKYASPKSNAVRAKKSLTSIAVLAIAISSVLVTGCTTSGMFPPPPVFAKPNGSFLSKLSPTNDANPYAPAGGFNQPPARAPLFSGAATPFGGRSGSC